MHITAYASPTDMQSQAMLNFEQIACFVRLVRSICSSWTYLGSHSRPMVSLTVRVRCRVIAAYHVC